MLKNVFSYVFAAFAAFGSTLALAQENDTIPEVVLTDPGIDWTAIPAQLMSQLMVPLVVAIGIGLSIWAVRKGVRLFKSGANG